MHTVKRAIIMAAGVGKRMRPVTLDTPKPLVRVNGARLIDTVIAGLRQNGIGEIYVVVGYRKERFQGLERDWPGVKLIENPWYDTCNNISSLYVARNIFRTSLSWTATSSFGSPAPSPRSLSAQATTRYGRIAPRTSGC